MTAQVGTRGAVMDWARMLAYVTGTVDQELLARNEYLTAENRILKAQLNGRLKLSDAERSTLGEIGHRLGRTALAEVATVAKPDTVLAWYRKLVGHKFDGSKARRGPGNATEPHRWRTCNNTARERQGCTRSLGRVGIYCGRPTGARNVISDRRLMSKSRFPERGCGRRWLTASRGPRSFFQRPLEEPGLCLPA
jgi:hypothetical protein